MPRQKFSLQRGEPARVEVRWRAPFWKDIQIFFDGRPLGGVEDFKALKAGREFALPDGLGALHVQWLQSFGQAELRVLRNGQPLPGSSSDPQQRVAAAVGVVFFIAGLNALLGVLTLLFHIELLEQMGVGVGSVVLGLLYGVLALLVKKRRSKVALAIAIALFAIDGVLSVAQTAAAGQTPIGGVIMRVFLILPMVRAFGALRELEKPERSDTARAA